MPLEGRYVLQGISKGQASSIRADLADASGAVQTIFERNARNSLNYDFSSLPSVDPRTGTSVAINQAIDLPFKLPFFDKDYRRIFITNMGLSFGELNAGKVISTLKSGAPNLALMVNSNQLNGNPLEYSVEGEKPAGVFVRIESNRIIVTWLYQVVGPNSSQLTAQVVLGADGSLAWKYDQNYLNDTSVRNGIIGIFPGANLGGDVPFIFTVFEPSSVDVASPTAVHQDGNISNLSGYQITAQPTAGGGYHISALRSPKGSQIELAGSQIGLKGRITNDGIAVAGGRVVLSNGQGARLDDQGSFVLGEITASSVVYVAADAAPGGNGASWGAAFNSLENALNNPSVRKRSPKIWVKEGIYNVTRSLDPGAMKLIGGMRGDEVREGERPRGKSWSRIIYTGAGDYVMALQAVLEGFSFTGPDCHGARAIVTRIPDSTVIIRNCKFSDFNLTRGSAVNGNFQIENSLFLNNFTSDPDAGAAVSGRLKISNSIFVGNGGPKIQCLSGIGNCILNHVTLIAPSLRGETPSVNIAENANLIVVNSILSHTGGGSVLHLFGPMQSLGSFIEGDPTDRNVGLVSQFVNVAQPAGNDGIWGTADDGLILAQGSDLMGKGLGWSSTIDYRGMSRAEMAPDPGAYQGGSAVAWPIVRELSNNPLYRPARFGVTVFDANGIALGSFDITPFKFFLNDLGTMDLAPPVFPGLGQRRSLQPYSPSLVTLFQVTP